MKKVIIRFSIAFIVASVAFEIVLRVFVTTPSIHIYDEELGFRYQPHARLFLGNEGFAENTLNSLGLNDDEIAEKVQKRALIIGDSYTEAKQVFRKDNFTSLSEKSLPEWDIVNAGRDGLHIVNFPVIAQRLADVVKPDLIVLSINNGDFKSDLLSQEIVSNVLNNGETILRVKPTANDQIKQNFAIVVETSAIAVQLIRQFKSTLLSFYRKIKSGSFFAKTKTHQANIRKTPESELNAIRYQRLNLIVNELQNIAPVAFLFIHQIDFHPDRKANAAFTPSQSAEAVRVFSQKQNLVFENTAANLIKQYQQSGTPGFGFHNTSFGDGHLNELGHQAVAKSLNSIISRFDQEVEK